MKQRVNKRIAQSSFWKASQSGSPEVEKDVSPTLDFTQIKSDLIIKTIFGVNHKLEHAQGN